MYVIDQTTDTRSVICGICLSASFTQYIVTITQVQESVSDFNLESESGHF